MANCPGLVPRGGRCPVEDVVPHRDEHEGCPGSRGRARGSARLSSLVSHSLPMVSASPWRSRSPPSLAVLENTSPKSFLEEAQLNFQAVCSSQHHETSEGSEHRPSKRLLRSRAWRMWECRGLDLGETMQGAGHLHPE